MELLNRVREGQSIALIRGASTPLDNLVTIGLIVDDSQGQARLRNKLYERFAELFTATQGAMEASGSTEPGDTPWSLQNHAVTMFNLAQEVENQSPLMAVICAGVAMEAVLLAA